MKITDPIIIKISPTVLNNSKLKDGSEYLLFNWIRIKGINTINKKPMHIPKINVEIFIIIYV
jgi:hypothetical protein